MASELLAVADVPVNDNAVAPNVAGWATRCMGHVELVQRFASSTRTSCRRIQTNKMSMLMLGRSYTVWPAVLLLRLAQEMIQLYGICSSSASSAISSTWLCLGGRCYVLLLICFLTRDDRVSSHAGYDDKAWLR